MLYGGCLMFLVLLFCISCCFCTSKPFFPLRLCISRILNTQNLFILMFVFLFSHCAVCCMRFLPYLLEANNLIVTTCKTKMFQMLWLIRWHSHVIHSHCICFFFYSLLFLLLYLQMLTFGDYLSIRVCVFVSKNGRRKS